MPELPEVENIKLGLEDSLKNKTERKTYLSSSYKNLTTYYRFIAVLCRSRT